MFRAARTPGSDHGNPHGLRNQASEFAIKAFAGAIAIHGGEQNFSRPTALSFLRPLKRASAGRFAATRSPGFEVCAISLGVDGDNNRLRTETLCDAGD